MGHQVFIEVVKGTMYLFDYSVKPNRVVPTSKHKMYTIGVNVIL